MLLTITVVLSKITVMVTRGGSRVASSSKMECFVIINNGFKPLTIITKHSILDVAAVLDPPLVTKLITSTITTVKTKLIMEIMKMILRLK